MAFLSSPPLLGPPASDPHPKHHGRRGMPAPAQPSKDTHAPAARPEPPRSPPQPQLCLLPLPGASLRHHPPHPLAPPWSSRVDVPGSSSVSAGTACYQCSSGMSQVLHKYRASSRWIPGPFSWAQGCTQRRAQSAPAACVIGGGGGSPPEAQLGRDCTDAAHGLGAARGTHRTHRKQSWGTRQPEGGEETPALQPPRFHESGQAQAGADGPALSGRLGRH